MTPEEKEKAWLIKYNNLKFKNKSEENNIILSANILDHMIVNAKAIPKKLLILICRDVFKNDGKTPVQLSLDQIREGIGVQSKIVIGNAIIQIEKEGHITPQYKGGDTSRQAVGKGFLICDWCNAEVLNLKARYYPTHTLMVCQSCHDDYHIWIDQTCYRVNEDIVSIKDELLSSQKSPLIKIII